MGYIRIDESVNYSFAQIEPYIFTILVMFKNPYRKRHGVFNLEDKNYGLLQEIRR